MIEISLALTTLNTYRIIIINSSEYFLWDPAMVTGILIYRFSDRITTLRYGICTETRLYGVNY